MCQHSELHATPDNMGNASGSASPAAEAPCPAVAPTAEVVGAQLQEGLFARKDNDDSPPSDRYGLTQASLTKARPMTTSAFCALPTPHTALRQGRAQAQRGGGTGGARRPQRRVEPSEAREPGAVHAVPRAQGPAHHAGRVRPAPHVLLGNHARGRDHGLRPAGAPQRRPTTPAAGRRGGQDRCGQQRESPDPRRPLSLLGAPRSPGVHDACAQDARRQAPGQPLLGLPGRHQSQGDQRPGDALPCHGRLRQPRGASHGLQSRAAPALQGHRALHRLAQAGPRRGAAQTAQQPSEALAQPLDPVHFHVWKGQGMCDARRGGAKQIGLLTLSRSARQVSTRQSDPNIGRKRWRRQDTPQEAGDEVATQAKAPPPRAASVELPLDRAADGDRRSTKRAPQTATKSQRPLQRQCSGTLPSQPQSIVVA
eukprot:scaffold48_cov311-Pinguiococcus_pyrenoidosus.AAC.303